MTDSTNTFSVGIIGLGNIGMLFDYDLDGQEVYLSHLKAFQQHPSFSVSWVVDTNEDLLKMARSRYGSGFSCYDTLESVEMIPDIVVIATPTEITRNLFQKVKHWAETKLFLLEKPFVHEDLSAKDIEEYSDRCIVNYIRKYLPFFRSLKSQLNHGKLGKPLAINIKYTKGLMNNGSHFIDLMNYLLGYTFDLHSIQIIDTIQDYSAHDLSVSFSVNYKYEEQSVPIIFQCGDERLYSIIELDFLFESSRIRIFDFERNAEISVLKPDEHFDGYLNLRVERTEIVGIEKYALFMCDYLNQLLEGETVNISSLRNELEKNRLVEAILNKIN